VLQAIMVVLGVALALYDIAINAEAVRAEEAGGRAVLSRLHGGYALGLSIGAPAAPPPRARGSASSPPVDRGGAAHRRLRLSAGALSRRASDAHHDNAGGSSSPAGRPR
jgi:hypothetical protein